MAKNRHNKVKRYHRSFYTPKMRVRRVLGIAALVLAVLAAAWFAAPYVLDWGTHTWYTVVRGRSLSGAAVSSSEASAEPEASAASSAPEQPEQSAAAGSSASAEPEPELHDKAEIVSGSWAAVERSALTDEAAIRAAAQKLVASGTAYALITLKDSAGNIYYASTVPAAAESIAEKTVDPALIASVFKEYGVIPVARIAAFRDPIAAYTDRDMAIHYRSGGETDYLWLDAANAAAGGKAWLNPYSAGAVGFVSGLMDELRDMGFEHIALSCVQFPSAVSSKQDFGASGGISRDAQLAADINAWQEEYGDTLAIWLYYPLGQCTETSSALGAPAWSLGMNNLIIEASASDTLSEEQRAELLAAAAEAGIEHTVIRDDAAGRFE